MLFPSAIAFPGYGKVLADMQKRAAAPIDSVEDSNEMIGDLVSPGPTSTVGQV